MLGTWKYIQLSHQYLSLVFLGFELWLQNQNKLPAIDGISAQLNQTEEETLHSQI
jgi:hypothetical protein